LYGIWQVCREAWSAAVAVWSGGHAVDDVERFGAIVGLLSAAGLLAVGSNRLSERIRVPAPALFLIAAAIVSDVVPALGHMPIVDVQRVVTVMLVLLLFDGGMHIGWRRFRRVAGAVLWIGVLGTIVTTAGIAVAAHLLLGFGWHSSLLLGVALAPTDPAVVFSVLGRREVTGRSGTLLEGESGANDPVGIAAMAAVLGAGAGGWTSVAGGAGEFARQMGIGAVAGLLGGYLLAAVMRRLALPSGSLYPLRTLLAAGLIYGLTVLVHGSGFLAVFVAGIVVGDIRAPYKAEIERFHAALASLAEIVAFGVLGLTVSVSALAKGDGWLAGLGLAVLLALIIRPLLVGGLLLPLRLTAGERVFVMWSGLKGAVPILLGTYLLSAAVPEADRLYQVVVVVVAFSVVVQGGLVPSVARRAGVPMRILEPEPWSLNVRLREEPTGLREVVVAAGSLADGMAVRDLDLGEHMWISLVNRSGELLPVNGATVLHAGDEVLLLVDPDSAQRYDVFTSPQP
jgi:potassium/hydrogen antiporter